MLYDQHGKPIAEGGQTRPSTGQSVFFETSDRQEYDVSRGLTPAAVDRIMIAANSGDIEEQCRLSTELPEKNWDVAHALQTRRNAVLGIPSTIEPASDSPRDKAIAEAYETARKQAGNGNKLDSFADLRADLLTALLPGFSASEIVWKQGGGLAGFKFVDQRHFTLRDGEDLKLVSSNYPLGLDLPPGKFVVHKHRRHGGDIARGGLIRPLAWLHCFSNLNVKDLLRFVERYGMPFTVIKVNQEAWDKERNTLKNLIRNFGSDGGGVFTHGVEHELLQAANNTGDVYFKLLEYLGDAITKVVLGQTATAGDAGGWSKGSAQSQVRQDILEFDCAALDSTENDQLIPAWVALNYGPGVPCPRVVTDASEPEDSKALADVQKINAEKIEIAGNAGYEPVDDDEVSEAIGIKVKKKAADKTGMQPAPSPPAANAAALAADPTTFNLQPSTFNLNSWLDPLQQQLSTFNLQPSTFNSALSADLLDSFGDSKDYEELLASTIYAAAAAGKAKKAEELAKKEK